MERAEFAAGSIEVRASRAIHRILSTLGAFFLGIGAREQREQESGNWWDREEDSRETGAERVPMTLGRQAELFDPTGHAVFTPEIPRVEAVRESRRVVPVPQTIVTVQSRSKTTARVVATTRSATSTRVSAVTKTAKASRGSVARHLVMSQSISSGKEEARWFSVPQRVLLPRYQLFEGAPAVTEEQGQLRIGSPCLRTQRGRVWFV